MRQGYPPQCRQEFVADQAHAGERVADRHAAPMGPEDQEIGAGLFPARAQLLVAFLGAAEDEPVAQQRGKGLVEVSQNTSTIAGHHALERNRARQVFPTG